MAHAPYWLLVVHVCTNGTLQYLKIAGVAKGDRVEERITGAFSNLLLLPNATVGGV